AAIMLAPSALGQAILRNSWTTNSTGKLPLEAMPLDTNPLTPLMTRINNGTNVTGVLTIGSAFTSTGTNLAIVGNVSVRGTLATASATVSNYFRTPFLDIGSGTNFNANLSSFQGVTLTAAKEYNYTNGADGTRLLLRFQQDGSGGWVPNLSHVTWLSDTNSWNTN